MPEARKHRLLVVDDAPDTREVLHRNLTSRGYDVITARDVAEALRILSSARVDLVITDLKMPGASGLDLVRHVREHLRGAEVITITGYPSVEGAVSAVRSGAEEYLTKPFTQDELFAAVARAIGKLGAPDPRERPAGQALPDRAGLVAASEAMQRALAAASAAAATENPVLIAGERGTGKTTIARLIHRESRRAAMPFVVIHGDGGSNDWLESQLFGEVVPDAGGVARWRAGLLHSIGMGTVFLDEVSSLAASGQRRLAEALVASGSAAPDATPRASPACRLIAASTEDLRALVALGAFREDLFLRLSIHSVAPPPLRSRADDIVPLAQRFLSRHATARGRPVPAFSDGAQDILRAYPWPGNLAELGNCMLGLAVSAAGAVIDAADLPDTVRAWSGAVASVNRTLAEVEAEHIRAVLASVGGHKSRAADILGINRKTLREKLKDGDPERAPG
jgi:DNA-binding NtrC family response regulator